MKFTYLVNVKSTGTFFQIFAAFLDNTNCNNQERFKALNCKNQALNFLFLSCKSINRTHARCKSPGMKTDSVFMCDSRWSSPVAVFFFNPKIFLQKQGNILVHPKYPMFCNKSSVYGIIHNQIRVWGGGREGTSKKVNEIQFYIKLDDMSRPGGQGILESEKCVDVDYGGSPRPLKLVSR